VSSAAVQNLLSCLPPKNENKNKEEKEKYISIHVLIVFAVVPCI
jgi:hypothetical protein